MCAQIMLKLVDGYNVGIAIKFMLCVAQFVPKSSHNCLGIQLSRGQGIIESHNV